MNILITGVGGPTPRSFGIALKRYGSIPGISLIATDINPLSVGLYQKELFDAAYVIPRADDPKYRYAIESIIDKEQIDLAVILPEKEVEVWAEWKDRNSLPVSTLIPDLSIVRLLVDKAKMTEVLRDHDLVPDSVSFPNDPDAIQEVFDRLGDMFWVRSAAGTSGLGSLQIESPNNLRQWMAINPNVEKFLASRFLPGRNLACKMLYHNGQLLRTACAERVNYIMAKVAPSGITGNTSFGRLLNEPELVDRAIKAMDLLFGKSGAEKHGFFTADFKEDENGVPYLTEVNVRHVAFTQCFAAGGANFAEDTIRLLTNDPHFDRNYRMYEFKPDLIFLRDVDALPVLMKEKDLLKNTWA